MTGENGPIPPSNPGVISMSLSWPTEALRYLRREKHPNPKVKLAALNSASATSIGGIYFGGGNSRVRLYWFSRCVEFSTGRKSVFYERSVYDDEDGNLLCHDYSNEFPHHGDPDPSSFSRQYGHDFSKKEWFPDSNSFSFFL